MQVSASLLKRWMSCPLQARFAEIDERPELINAKTVFGTLIHTCLEDYNLNGDIDQSIALWKKMWARPEIYDRKIDFYAPRTSFRSYMGKGVDILREYHERQSWVGKRKVLAAEHRFLVPFGRHTLKGFVDLLELRYVKGQPVLYVIDYKTASRQPTVVQLRQDIQMTSYSWASYQREFWLGDEEKGYAGVYDGERLYDELIGVPRKLVWHGLWMNKAFDAGDRIQNDYDRMYRVIEMIERAIETEVFVPNISGESCMFCSYQIECGLPLITEGDTLELLE